MGRIAAGPWTRSRTRQQQRRRVPLALLLTLLLAVGTGLVGRPAVAAAACADLQVSSWSTDPTAPQAPGGGFALVLVIADVTNTGTCAAGPFVTQLQSPMDPQYWQKVTTDSLAPGATATVRFGVDLDGPGTYQTTVVVDLDQTVAETDEGDNRQVVPITVTAATVDLAVTEVVLDPERPVRGKPMTMTATIHNFGTSTDHGFQVGWSPSWDSYVEPVRVEGLAAGAEKTVTFTRTYPKYWNYSSVVAVDASQEIPESDERNNQYSFIVPVDPVGPDLVVQGLRLSPSNPAPGQSASATFTIRNAGNTDASRFHFSWQPWEAATVRSAYLTGLAAGATTTVTFKITVPATAVLQGLATVDPRFAVKEIEEGNNTLGVNVPVAPNRINLSVAFDVQPTQAKVGDLVTAKVRATNSGNTSSGPFRVDWNPDATGLLGPRDRSTSQDVGNLARGESRTLTFSHVYARSGTFSTAATLDADHRVVELTTTDNRRAWPVTVTDPAADLRVAKVALGTAATAGEPTTAAVTVTNAGRLTSAPSALRWRVPGAREARVRVEALAPGQSRTVRLSTTIARPGKARTTLVVDADDQVAEGRRGERNNVRVEAVRVARSAGATGTTR